MKWHMIHPEEKKKTLPNRDTVRQVSPPSNLFLSGVAVLTMSTVLVKLIGLFYKIPMLHYLGSEGMGYFNAAYEWYATLCVLSTAGLPLAISMLIAQARATHNQGAIDRIEKISVRLFILLGIVGSLLLFFGASTISSWIGSPKTKLSIMAVAPTLFFSCISGAYRGFFQGYQNMLPTAVSQIIEALGKLILGLGFGVLAWRKGLETPVVAAWAMLGLSVGVAISTLYLVLYRRANRTDKCVSLPQQVRISSRAALAGLTRIAVPVTLSSAVLSFTRVLDTAVILRRLQSIGYDATLANTLYGSYTTMAIPIFNLIPSLVTSVSLALIPTLKGAIEVANQSEQRSTVQTAVRITALLSLPSSFAVAIYSKSILHLLFRGEETMIETTAPMLSVLAVSIFFSGLITTTNAILQAYGHVNAPIFSMLTGAMLKFFSAYFLIGQPQINVYGAPISTFLCDGCIVCINLMIIAKQTDVLTSLKDVLYRPLVVSVIAVGVPGIVYSALLRAGYSEIPLFFTAVPVTVLLFVALCLRSGLVGEKELALLPTQRITRIFKQFRRTSGTP